MLLLAALLALSSPARPPQAGAQALDPAVRETLLARELSGRYAAALGDADGTFAPGLIGFHLVYQDTIDDDALYTSRARSSWRACGA
jgi:hypothetical protein